MDTDYWENNHNDSSRYRIIILISYRQENFVLFGSLYRYFINRFFDHTDVWSTYWILGDNRSIRYLHGGVRNHCTVFSIPLYRDEEAHILNQYNNLLLPELVQQTI